MGGVVAYRINAEAAIWGALIGALLDFSLKPCLKSLKTRLKLPEDDADDTKVIDRQSKVLGIISSAATTSMMIVAPGPLTLIPFLKGMGAMWGVERIAQDIAEN